METLERFLLVSAIVLFVYVFYKWLLKYFKSKEIQGSFPYVFPFEEPLRNEMDLKFELPNPASVRVEVCNEQGEMEKLFFEDKLSAGLNSINLSFSDLPRGKHELVLTFPNQVTRRVLDLA